MVEITWTVDGGWNDATVRPYGPLQLDPAASVLHYAQEIFEGLKAYRHADGSIWGFRPEANARRMQRSAARLALPPLPVEHFIESLRQLIAVDGAWVPSAPETSLYLRPFMIATEAFLGVRAGAQGRLLRHRQSRRAPTSRGGVAPGVDLVVDEVLPGGQGRHRSGEDRRQLRGMPAAAGRGVRARLRTRCSSSTRQRASTSRSSAA